MSHTHTYTHTGQENRESPPGPAGRTTKDDDGCDACALTPLLCSSRGGDITAERPAPTNQTVESSACRLLAGFSPLVRVPPLSPLLHYFSPQHDGLSDSANKGSFHGDEVRNRFWSTCIFFFFLLQSCRNGTEPCRAVPCRVVSC